MVDAATFVIRLIDAATAPAKRIAAAMKTVEKSLKPIKNNAAFKALDRAGTKMFEIGKQAVLLGGVLGVGLAGALTVASVKSAMFTENTELAFEQLTHSASGGAAAFKTVKDLVADLGLDLHDTTEGMRKLLAAQFSLGESTELLKMSADLSAIGIHGEEAARVLMAISQIKAKGKLQQEEMLQLAEAGISLTLVNGQLQQALGKTGAELEKMKQAGKVTGDVGIAAIKAAVKQKLGITEFGQARQKFIEHNLSGMIEQLKSTGQLLFLKLGDSIKEAAVAMGPLVKETTEWVKNLDTANITSVVTSVLDTVRKLVPLGMQFIKGFVRGLSNLGDKFKLDVNGDTLVAAARAGEQLAEALGMALELARMAAKAIGFLTTPVGKFIAYGFLAAVAVTKLISVIGTIASVIGPVASAISAIGSLFQGLIFIFAHALGTGAITAFFGGIASALQGVWFVVAVTAKVGLGLLASFAAGIGGLVATIVAAVALVGYQLKKLFDITSLSELFEMMRQDFIGFGKGVVLGMAQGVVESAQFVVDAVTGLGQSAVNAVKSVLGIASPSKEFEWLGAQSALGYVKGLEANAPSGDMFAANTNAAAAFDSAAAVLPSASASAARAQTLGEMTAPAQTSGITIGSITVPVQVVGGSEDPKALAQAIAALLPDQIALALEALTSPSPQAA